MFILIKREKGNKKSVDIFINQQPSLPASDMSAPKTKVKDQKRAGAARWGQKKLSEKSKGKAFKR